MKKSLLILALVALSTAVFADGMPAEPVNSVAAPAAAPAPAPAPVEDRLPNFFAAVRSGDQAFVRTELNNRAVGINAQQAGTGDTAMHIAVGTANIAMLDLLWTFNPDWRITNNAGRNVLQAAIANANPLIVNWLASKGIR